MNERLLQSAWRLHQAGNLVEAARLYAEVLRSEPRNFNALQLLGFLHFQRGQYQDAERLMEAALGINPNSLDALYNRGCALLALERPGEALACFERALALKPDLVPALLNRGNTLSQMGRFEDAVFSYDNVIALAPSSADAFLNRGNALFELKRFAEALANYERASSLEPRDPLAWSNRGNALAELGRHQEAIASFGKALALVPEFPEALEGRGNLYLLLDRNEDALADFDRALVTEPDASPLLHARGRALAKLQRHGEALAAFDKALGQEHGRTEIRIDKGISLIALRRFEEALAAFDAVPKNTPGLAVPVNRASALIGLKRYEDALADSDAAIAGDKDSAEAWHNRASALAGLRRFAEAIEAFDKVLMVRPGSAASRINRGNAFISLTRYDEALADFDRALSLEARNTEAMLGRANALFHLKRMTDSRETCEAVLRIAPDREDAQSLALRCRLHACDWHDYDKSKARIAASLSAGRQVISPLDAKAICTSEAENAQAARLWMAETCPPSPIPLWRGEAYRHDKIRLAYLSSDFRTHAVASLIAGVFEHHDRNRFETVAVSFGPDDGSELRGRIAGAFDRFIDARAMSDGDMAAQLRALEIDIAVDLNGYTGDARTRIFAARPAPIQVNYLGFPGTMCAPYMDYIIADRIVIPEANAAHYAEKVAYLPHAYQPNDSRRVMPAREMTRAQAGLPERSFVFCCFNNSYKIAPEIFGVWMHLLRETPDSVLWLLADNASAADNLRREATARGIDAERLVFAPRVTPEDHLARHRLAGLFLDTSPYNAHTTASDALWMGLPLVTRPGQTFPSRVAASLLTAAGMTELIADSLGRYEEVALKLAREAATLAAVKETLARNRDTCALFDTARYTRHLEAAYFAMWERSQRGAAPESFAIAP